MVQDSSCIALHLDLSCLLRPSASKLVVAVRCDDEHELYIQDAADCLKIQKCVLLHECCMYRGKVCDLEGKTA